MNKLVSIIIPTFNSGKNIYECLFSIKNQNFKNFIVIVIDSGSTDKTLDIVNSFKKDFEIMVINSGHNGPMNARYLGIKKTNSKYIAFLDSDDYWEKNKLNIQIRFMERNKIDFSCTGYEIIKDKKSIKIFYINRNLITFNTQLFFREISNSSVILKRDILIDFMDDHENIYAEDYLLWMKILMNGYKCIPIKQNLTKINIHSNNRSANFIKQTKDLYFIYSKKLKISNIKILIIFIIYLLVNLKKIPIKMMYG